MAQSSLTSFYQTRKKSQLHATKRRRLEQTDDTATFDDGKASKGLLLNPPAPEISDSKTIDLPEQPAVKKTKTTRKAPSKSKKVKGKTLLELDDSTAVQEELPPSPIKPEKLRRGRRQRIQDNTDQCSKKEEPEGYSFNLFVEKPKKTAKRPKKNSQTKLVLQPVDVDVVDGGNEESKTVENIESKIRKVDNTNEGETNSKKPSTKKGRKKKELEVAEKQDTEVTIISSNEDKSSVKDQIPLKEDKPAVKEKISSKENHSHEVEEKIAPEKEEAAPKDEIIPVDEKKSDCSKTEEKLEPSSTETKILKKSKSTLKTFPNAATVKARLQKCGKLADLQEQLAQMNKHVAKVQSARKKLEQSSEKSEPVKEEKPQEASTSKDDTETKPTAPAYQRFHNLAQKVPSTLPLPFKYKLLHEMFFTADTVVSMLHNRHELCTFNKLKVAVEQMLRKKFQTHNLGQIKQVYPTAYKYRQEKNIPNVAGKSSDYQLTLEPVLDETQLDETVKKHKHLPFQANQLVERKAIFHHSLIDIVKQHHSKFLAKLDRPLSVPDDKITRWHPKFPLDEVADIQPAELPEPPNKQKVVTATEALKTASDKFNERVKNALENVAANNEKNATNNNVDKKATEVPSKPETSALSKVNSSLLERIRSKEAKNVALSMVLSPSDQKRQLMVSRMPALTRSLRSIFITEKRPALGVECCVQKLCDSYPSAISVEEMEKHLSLMIELLPDWVQVVKTYKGKFVKLDRNRDLAQVHESLKKHMKNV